MKKILAACGAAVIAAGAIVAAVVVPGGNPAPPKPPVFTVGPVLTAPMPQRFVAPVKTVAATRTVAASTGAEKDGSALPPDEGMPPDMSCGTDMTTVLQRFLNHIPNGAIIQFPRDPADPTKVACYTVGQGLGAPGDGLQFANASGVTIQGNGAVLNEPNNAPTWNGTSITDQFIPFLLLTNDSSVTINDINFQGPWNGKSNTQHGVHYEGKTGFQTQASANVSVTNSTVRGALGDGFDVSLPVAAGYPVTPTAGVINSGITLAGSTLENIGYVPIASDSVNGETINYDTINVGQNAMDMELDDGGSAFVGGVNSITPAFAAQDNILIENSTFAGFNEVWYTSLQGTGVPNPGMSRTASATDKSTTLTISSVTGITNGMVVTGKGIPPGTPATVTHINTGTSTVTISGATPGGLATGTSCKPVTSVGCYVFAAPTCTQTTGLCSPPGCVGTACTNYWATQQWNVTLKGNTINCLGSFNPCLLTTVRGIRGDIGFSTRNFNINLTYVGNTLNGAAESTSGGSECIVNSGSTMAFTSIARVTVIHNIFHGTIGKKGLCAPGVQRPYLGAVTANDVHGLTIENNDFTNDASVLNPANSSQNEGVVTCGNTYGLNGATVQASC